MVAQVMACDLVTVFAIYGVPLLLGLLCLLLLCRLLPWLFTVVVGESYETTYVMQAHHQYDRKLCEYRLTGGPMEGAVPGYLCINESSYRRHLEQPVQVLLTGQRSVLGVRIKGIYENEPRNTRVRTRIALGVVGSHVEVHARFFIGPQPSLC
ncbi:MULTISPECIES: hypothetical protein [Xanthomonas]|uniref:hypothetical protein n=1 Tax=Xanthomonas TaxID=338 RepID=UPI0011188372|nr:hypothetical protein [Xanthomonas phaseoli]MBO9769355.1 hypothetical protein [Xanthomonas phaseoli pv. dieffenbachiae]MBO9780051.1 hypothetical protein [Xanthomonas phaseoli pv. dieffenbachiae]MBO9789771.1 hypothetical protein [Xanthomonas phaseoli pv. dieffenbachiae]MBO9794915.1 hypothetical protein [Xanthomonas phaseoli pv. dieffenbachiae]MBO9801019.1 hypothetical protein [Xanthomonas phaseoli pv. dieffenbachiae]